MKAWVCSGCWLVSDWEYEDLWARADDDAKRVNDLKRFEAELQAARSLSPDSQPELDLSLNMLQGRRILDSAG